MERGRMIRRLTRRRLLALGGSALLAPLAGEASARTSRSATRLQRVPLDPAAASQREGWRTFPALALPSATSIAGVAWARERPDALQVRTRRAGGEWSDWARVGTHGHGGEGGRATRASDPVGVAGARELQLRVRGHADGLVAQLVRAKPAAQAPRARSAQAGGPAIIPRSAWGGDSVKPRGAPSYGAVQAAFVHHTVNPNSYTPDEAAAMVLGMARYHRDVNKWDDLGYNFVVDRFGRIYEGRAGGIDKAVIGAQAQGYNAQSTGVAILGTFEDVDAPPQALEAVAHVVAWKLALHGAPASGAVVVTSAGGELNRYKQGARVTLQRVCGHRDGDQTACPGARLYAQLPQIRQRAIALQGSLYRTVAPVTAVVHARAASKRVREGKAVLIRGTRAPAGGVDVLIERRIRGRYRRVGKLKARSRKGSFSARVRLRKASLYRLTAIADGARAAPVFVRAVKRRKR